MLKTLTSTVDSARILPGCLVVCALHTLAPVASAAPRGDGNNSSWQVTITDLGLLPDGIYASAHAINASGQIAGMGQQGPPDYWGHAEGKGVRNLCKGS